MRQTTYQTHSVQETEALGESLACVLAQAPAVALYGGLGMGKTAFVRGLALKDVDVFAAVVGPGSFTGIRIGTAAVKGFAWAQSKPCAGISSLSAMAWDCEQEGTLCCSIRARANESYYAVFRREKGSVIRLTEDAVGSDEEMESIAREHGCTLFPRDCQRASGAARAAWALAQSGKLQTCHEIVPSYLRATQVERMRKEQMK